MEKKDDEDDQNIFTSIMLRIYLHNRNNVEIW